MNALSLAQAELDETRGQLTAKKDSCKEKEEDISKLRQRIDSLETKLSASQKTQDDMLADHRVCECPDPVPTFARFFGWLLLAYFFVILLWLCRRACVLSLCLIVS